LALSSQPMVTDSDSQQVTDPPAVNPQALSFILDWVKDTPERQSRDTEYLNSKVLQVFTAASILIGFVGFSNTVAPGPSPSRNPVVTALVVLALVTYLVVTLFTFFTIRTTALSVTRLGYELWQKYWKDEEDTIKRGLVQVVGEAYAKNEPILRRKSRNIQVVLILTGIEALFATVAVAYARLT
jgi:hypothetical protein